MQFAFCSHSHLASARWMRQVSIAPAVSTTITTLDAAPLMGDTVVEVHNDLVSVRGADVSIKPGA